MGDQDFEVVNIIKRIPDKDGFRNSLDEKALSEILLHPDVGDIPVALYSIVGPFRSGKSFFLNLFLKYLHQKFLSDKGAANDDKVHDIGDEQEQNHDENLITAREDNKKDESVSDHENYHDKSSDADETYEKISDDKSHDHESSPKSTEDSFDESRDESYIGNVFSWKGGLERHTEGILIMKKPIIVSTEDHPKVALFLMDTQGMFDHKEATQNSARIGALSFLICSMQLFNIMTQLDGNHLQYIYRFARFAKDIKEHDSGNSPFQSLLFLVRDWKRRRTFPHGFKGGKQYIDNVMHTSSSQAHEHKCVRDDLYQTFDDIACYLLPPPGEEVEVADEPFQLFPVTDIHPNFFEKTNELFEHICSPANLVVKKVHGKAVSARELLHYIVAYSTIMNGDLEENVQSFLLAGFNAKMKNIITKCLVNYRRKLSEMACMEWKKEDWSKLEEVHVNLTNEALSFFDEEEKPGNDEFVEKWRQDLEVLINSSFGEIKELVKKVFKVALEDYQKALSSGLQLKGEEELTTHEKETHEKFSFLLKSQLDPDVAEVFSQSFSNEAAVLFTEIQDLNIRNRKIAGTVVGAAVGAVAIGTTILLEPLAPAALALGLRLSSSLAVGTGAAVWGKMGNTEATQCDTKEETNADESSSSSLKKYPALERRYEQTMTNREPIALQQSTSACSLSSQSENDLSSSKSAAKNKRKEDDTQFDNNLSSSESFVSNNEIKQNIFEEPLSSCGSSTNNIKNMQNTESENSLLYSEGLTNNNENEQKSKVTELHTPTNQTKTNQTKNQENDSSFQSLFSSFKSLINKGVTYLDETLAINESAVEETAASIESENPRSEQSNNPQTESDIVDEIPQTDR